MGDDPEKRVLDYATPGSVGPTTIVPEAESLIDARAPLRMLRPLFRSGVEAGRYLAKSLQRRAQDESRCINCYSEQANLFCGCQWTMHQPMRFFEMLIRNNYSLDFSTFHQICPNCLIELKKELEGRNQRLRWLEFVQACEIVIIPTGLLVGCLGETAFMLVTISGVLLAIVACRLAAIRMRCEYLKHVPRSLREFVPPGVKLRYMLFGSDMAVWDKQKKDF